MSTTIETNANATANTNDKGTTTMDSNTTSVTNATNTTNAASTVTVPDPSPLPPSPMPFVAPPPNVQIPSPPSGFTPLKGGFGTGVKPRKSELVALPDAVVELEGFVDYAGTLGKTVPPQQQAAQTMDTAAKWSVMRVESRAWDAYAANEEGVAWKGARAVMSALKPAFELAVKADPSLAQKYPKLAVVLGAKSAIAKKSGSTRKKNSKAVAEGNAPTHGVVGKKKQRAAEKAAAAAAAATAATHGGETAKPAGGATAATSPNNGAGGTNGATHS